MTREKEITKEAKKFAKEIDDWEIAEDVQDAFVQCAQWADQHPVNYDGKAMLYVNNRSHENGYKERLTRLASGLKRMLQTFIAALVIPIRLLNNSSKR